MSDPKPKIGLELTPLSEQRRAQAEKELRETPENVKQGVEALRQLLRDNPKLKYRDDDEFLIRFLRPTKFYPESALALMQRVADFKVKNAHILDNLLPADERVTIMEHDVLNVISGRDQGGRRILYTHFGERWDPKKVNTDNLFRVLYMVHLGALMEPETQVAGVVVIMDFLGMSMKQVSGFSPSFSMRLLSFIQEAMPLRLKEVHVVNQPFVFNMVFQMFKPFIGEKLKNRMFFHGKKMESLHKHMDPDFLPADLGGKLPKINYTSRDWNPVLESIAGDIAEWNSMGVVKA